MNIKSLLLGSAAALVAVSGARAADAVVIAEPEPMEYVRICDTYGTGFYYIPGTETCLKIGGYVRYDIGAGERRHDATITAKTSRRPRRHLRQARSRFSSASTLATETELGTLRSFAALNFNYRRRYQRRGGPPFVNTRATMPTTASASTMPTSNWPASASVRPTRCSSTFTGYSSGVLERRYRRLTVRSPPTPSATPSRARTASRLRSLSKKATTTKTASSTTTSRTLSAVSPGRRAGVAFRLSQLTTACRRRRHQGPHRRECDRAALAVRDGWLLTRTVVRWSSPRLP